jgi:hypothetical protein
MQRVRLYAKTRLGFVSRTSGGARTLVHGSRAGTGGGMDHETRNSRCRAAPPPYASKKRLSGVEHPADQTRNIRSQSNVRTFKVPSRSLQGAWRGRSSLACGRQRRPVPYVAFALRARRLELHTGGAARRITIPWRWLGGPAAPCRRRKSDSTPTHRTRTLHRPGLQSRPVRAFENVSASSTI